MSLKSDGLPLGASVGASLGTALGFVLGSALGKYGLFAPPPPITGFSLGTEDGLTDGVGGSTLGVGSPGLCYNFIA